MKKIVFSIVFVIVFSSSFAINTFAQQDEKGIPNATPTPAPVQSCPVPVKKAKKRIAKKPVQKCATCPCVNEFGKLITAQNDTTTAVNKNTEAINNNTAEQTKTNVLLTEIRDTLNGVLKNADGSFRELGIGDLTTWLRWIFWAVVIGFGVMTLFGIFRAGQGRTTNHHLNNIREEQVAENGRQTTFRNQARAHHTNQDNSLRRILEHLGAVPPQPNPPVNPRRNNNDDDDAIPGEVVNP